MFLEELGGRIREARVSLGLTQTAPANTLQVSPQAVSKWERGENAPDVTLIPDIANLLGVTADRLLGTHVRSERTFTATVCFADIPLFTQRSEKLSPTEVATVINAHYYQITEVALKFDGVPVKYIGDAFLYYFAGPEHERRALLAARAEGLAGTFDSGIAATEFTVQGARDVVTTGEKVAKTVKGLSREVTFHEITGATT